jgi:hypothetical protein
VSEGTCHRIKGNSSPISGSARIGRASNGLAAANSVPPLFHLRRAGMGAEERQIVALDVVKTWSLHPRKSCARSYRCRQHFVDQLERWESLLSAVTACPSRAQQSLVDQPPNSFRPRNGVSGRPIIEALDCLGFEASSNGNVAPRCGAAAPPLFLVYRY